MPRPLNSLVKLFSCSFWAVHERIKPTLIRGFPLCVAALGLLALGAAAGTQSSGPGAGLRVHRTWMPDAYPSSYAIGFPSGLNFCFDPIRGNVIYAWEGEYIDLAPTVNGKIPRNAVIKGKPFYQSLTTSDFRSGTKQADPEIRFIAFRVRNDIPEFEYEVDGIRVRESVRPTPDGKDLIRQFRVSTPDRSLTYRVSDPSKVAIESGPAKWADGALTLPGNSTIVFSLALTRP
jgi:hypothetical protein